MTRRSHDPRRIAAIRQVRDVQSQAAEAHLGRSAASLAKLEASHRAAAGDLAEVERQWSQVLNSASLRLEAAGAWGAAATAGRIQLDLLSGQIDDAINTRDAARAALGQAQGKLELARELEAEARRRQRRAREEVLLLRLDDWAGRTGGHR